MYKIQKEGLVDDQGNVFRYVDISSAAADPEWMAKQSNSMGEYVEHVQNIPAGINTLYQLFDGYIAAALSGRTEQKIIDVGCGINPEWPVYSLSLKKASIATGNIYVGLDPISYALGNRSYPFVCGRLEDAADIIKDQFDVFLFATSLDHFEDIGKLAAIVKKMSTHQAICLFWVGLHDPVIVAEELGVNLFSNMFNSLNPFRFIPRYILAALKVLRYYIKLVGRRSMLANDERLDDLHYYYFTQKNIFKFLRYFGEIEHSVRVPGTNSMFALVKVN